MQPGALIDDRFEIERPIGQGAMGTVYKATDRATGSPVAVKTLADPSGDTRAAFAREAEVLSALKHDCIVGYVAHSSSRSVPYLAMEWLNGEDLASRLARGRLSMEDTFALIRGIAGALGVAHALGVVHGDVKPANLFLQDGAPHRPKLLDFGLFRWGEHEALAMEQAALLGTVGYMAPEQVTGVPDIDGRADLFSLGCVLFECLTGTPAFAGRHSIAVLAKVLRQEVPRVGAFRADVSPSTDHLLSKLLAKDRTGRPRDAATLLSLLDETTHGNAAMPAPRESVRPAVTRAEQRVVSVLLAEPRDRAVERGDASLKSLRDLATRLGSGLTAIEGGGMVLVLSGRGVATDRAAEAARHGLRLKHAAPELEVALATGLAETTGPSPVGPVIDHAAALLRRSANVPITRDPDGVLVDDVTSRLLAGSFELTRDGDAQVLSGTLDGIDLERRLMGETTPTVGREAELAQLDSLLTESIQSRTPRAVVLTAAPGMGKSRVGRDFVAGARQRDDLRVLLVQAEAIAAGSVFDLAAKLVRLAVGMKRSTDPGAAHLRLRSYLEARLGEAAPLVADFLGEIAEAPNPGAPSPILRAARNDPSVMREQKRRAFEAWLDAETRTGPLAIVIEDLHWGDNPTLAYLGDALRNGRDRSLFILGLARPEVQDKFPGLWEGPSRVEMRLPGLPEAAAAALAACVLGERAREPVVREAIRLAEGNAFYLEEMLRCIAAGQLELPETVLAMVQSRLEDLEPEARHVLRAASVFGEAFWVDGVLDLVGDAVAALRWLEILVERELVSRSPFTRFAGCVEYTFRHALLRDAAYGLLTAADRSTAHGRAGLWLASKGASDARVVADHLEAGDQPALAIPWLVRAASNAASSDDLASVTTLADRGLALGASGSARGELLAVRTLATFVADAQVDVVALAEAAALLPERTAPWWLSVSLLIYGYGSLGRAQDSLPYVHTMLTTPPGGELIGPHGWGVTTTTVGLTVMGQGAMLGPFLDQFGEAGLDDPRCDSEFVSCLRLSRGIRHLWTRGAWAPESALDLTRSGLTIARSTGAAIAELSATLFHGLAWDALGQDAPALEYLTRSIDIGATSLTGVYGRLYLARRNIRTGRLTNVATSLGALTNHPEPTISAAALALLAEIHLLNGDTTQAIDTASAAMGGPAGFFTAWAAAALARAYLEAGKAALAASTARSALTDGSSSLVEVDADLLSSEALALFALGDHAAGEAAAQRAAGLVRSVGDTILDDNLRDGFFSVSENARALALQARGLEASLPWTR